MKTKFATLLYFIILGVALLPFDSFAQFSPGAPANFGIDGDLKNDYRMSGSFTATGTHDWFKLVAGSGIGIIDTTNTSGYIASLVAVRT